MSKSKANSFLMVVVASVSLVGESLAADETKDQWQRYFEEPNGNLYFYDTSRVKTDVDLHRVWNRIQYSRSRMGALSYQSLLEVDCNARTQQTLQHTFFTDKEWEQQAMNTNTSAKRKRPIKKGKASERLAEIVCE